MTIDDRNLDLKERIFLLGKPGLPKGQVRATENTNPISSVQFGSIAHSQEPPENTNPIVSLSCSLSGAP